VPNNQGIEDTLRQKYSRDEPGAPKREERHISKLSAALHSAKQKELKVDASAVLGSLVDHDGTDFPLDIVFRLNKKTDDNLALVAAHAHTASLAKHAGKGSDSFREDPAVTVDEGTIQALFRAARDPENPSKRSFITPTFMRDIFDTFSLNGLVNLYNEAIARMLGLPLAEELDLDEEREKLVAAFDIADMPEALLAMYNREVLTNLLCLFTMRWDTDRLAAVDAMKAALNGEEGWEKVCQDLVGDWHKPEPEIDNQADDERILCSCLCSDPSTPGPHHHAGCALQDKYIDVTKDDNGKTD